MVDLSLVITCEELAPPLNGVIAYSEDTTAPFNVLTMATYACNSGYRLEGGSTERTCVRSDDSSSRMGIWTGASPSCEGD